MAIAFSVNGVDRLAYLKDFTLEVDKEGGVEVARFETWDRVNPGAGAFRLVKDDEILIEDDSDLVFGGVVVQVAERAIFKGAGVASVTICEVVAKGYERLAQTIRVATFSAPSQGLLVTAEALCDAYLVGRGVTNIAATTGGPTLPAVEFDGLFLSEILDQLAGLAETWNWRINGDLEFGFVEAGALVGTAITEAIIREADDARVIDSDVDRATRLFLQTGGSGTAVHSESHVANGTQTVFPLNVESGRKRASFNNAGGYSSGATSINVDGLFPSQTLKAGDTFRVPGHDSTYTLSGSDITGDSEGAYTGLTFSPGLDAAVADDDALTFDARTFIRLQVGGVETSVRSGSWSYDVQSHSLTKSGGAPSAATVIRYTTPVVFPATVRVWDSSVVLSSGAVDEDAVVDARVDASQIADLEQAKNFGEKEINRRGAPPRELLISTRTKGYYPWMRVTVSIPSFNFSGIPYLVTGVRVDGFDGVNVVYTLKAVQGDIRTDAWFASYPRAGSTGGGSVALGSASAISGGGSAPPAGAAGASRIALGGSNLESGNATDWADVFGAIPTNLGGAALAGTWTLRVYRRCKSVTSPNATTIEVRLRDRTNGVTLATVTGTSSTTFAEATVSFAMPATPGVCLLEYRMVISSGTPAEGVVGMCSLEKD